MTYSFLASLPSFTVSHLFDEIAGLLFERIARRRPFEFFNASFEFFDSLLHSVECVEYLLAHAPHLGLYVASTRNCTTAQPVILISLSASVTSRFVRIPIPLCGQARAIARFTSLSILFCLSSSISVESSICQRSSLDGRCVIAPRTQ